MKTAIRVRTALILPLAALLVLGCSSGSSYNGSIYYYIENEEVVNDSSLDNEAGFFNVVRLGTAASPVYYAACGQIRKSASISGSGTSRSITWDTEELELPTASICTALVAFGGNLYGGFLPYQTLQSDMGLYKATVDAGGTLTSGFTQVTDSAVKGYQVPYLYVSPESGGDRLIAIVAKEASTDSTSTPYSYVIYRSGDGASFSQIYPATGTTLTACPKSITYQAYTGYYWILFDDHLVRLDGSTLSEVSVGPTLDTDNYEELRSVYCCTLTSQTLVYATSSYGYIYKTADYGSTWTASSQATISSVVVPFISFAEIPSYGGTTTCLAGAEGYGYYTVDDSLALVRYADTTYADLRASAIRSFYVDDRSSASNGTTTFAITTDYGLWRMEADSSIVWNQE